MTACPTCQDTHWVCETHLTTSWDPDRPCCGAPGVPCPMCNLTVERHPPTPPPMHGCSECDMTLNPDDPDAILADLDKQFDTVAEPDVADVTKLIDKDLSELFNKTRDRLLELGEMQADGSLTDKEGSPEGRELHSTRAACLVEMAKRGMR